MKLVGCIFLTNFVSSWQRANLFVNTVNFYNYFNGYFKNSIRPASG
jgi:hypothetical protein